MSAPVDVQAAAATAAQRNNQLRKLLQQKKQQGKPHAAAAAAAVGSAQSAPKSPQLTGQKRARDDDDAEETAAPKPSAAAAMAAKLEANSKHSHQKKKQKQAQDAAAAAARAKPAVPAPAASSTGGGERKLSALQQKMAAKLAGARFRWLNEKLYTTSSGEAWEYFQEHPEEFHEYHRGFGVQVTDWPSNPLDGFIDWLKARPTSLVVGDFGCGEARLAASVPNKVHSFDLVAANSSVVACNIAHVPLPPASLDVAVFCLSLMGVDFLAFIKEAHRTLKQGGVLLISEVKSRFEEAGLDVFLRAVQDVGFGLRRKDARNTMFVTLEFVKQGGGGAKGGAKGGEGKTHVPAEAADSEDDEEGEGAARAKTNGGGHDRNKSKKQKQKAQQKATSQKKQEKKDAKAGTQFTHPKKAAAGAAPADGAPLLSACIYKKR